MKQKRQDGQLRVNVREFHHTFHNHRFYTLKLCVGWFCFYESFKKVTVKFSSSFILIVCRPLFWTSWSGSIGTAGRSKDVQPEGSVKESFSISRSSGGSGVVVPIGARMQRWRMRPGKRAIKAPRAKSKPTSSSFEIKPAKYPRIVRQTRAPRVPLVPAVDGRGEGGGTAAGTYSQHAQHRPSSSQSANTNAFWVYLL